MRRGIIAIGLGKVTHVSIASARSNHFKSAIGIPPDACQLHGVPRWRAKTWWILGSLLLLQILAALGFHLKAIQRDIQHWEDYQRQCRSRGEDLGIKAWLPPEVADENNLFAHPWVVGFLDSEHSPQAKAVASLREWPDSSLDGYEAPTAGQSWFDGREAEAAAVLRAGQDRAADLRAIREAAGRSACRLPIDDHGSYEGMRDPWTRIRHLETLLALHADAALASGDGPAATADLEAMLRIGKHLRGCNFLLSTMIGTGFEGRTLPLIDAGLQRSIFGADQKQRLFLALRTRPVDEEWTAVMRVERGLFLAALKQMNPNRPPTGFREQWAARLNPPKRLVATNSLHFCRLLEAPLSAGGDRAAWESFSRHIDEIPRDQRSPLTEIAAAGLYMTNMAPALFVQEDELDLLRKRLAE